MRDYILGIEASQDVSDIGDYIAKDNIDAADSIVESLFLADAFSPRLLPDGSLLVGRWNANGQQQIYRFGPEGERLEALDAFGAAGSGLMAFRPFPDGKAAVFFGKPKGVSSAPDQL